MIPYRQFCKMGVNKTLFDLRRPKFPLLCSPLDCNAGPLYAPWSIGKVTKCRPSVAFPEVSRAAAGARVGAVHPRKISGISTTGGRLSPGFAQLARKDDHRPILPLFLNGARWHLSEIRNSLWPFAPADVSDEITNAFCLFSFDDEFQNLRNLKCLCNGRKYLADGGTVRYEYA